MQKKFGKRYGGDVVDGTNETCFCMQETNEMWTQLPKEIKTKIFLYDRTRKESFDKVLHQIEMKPVLTQLEVFSFHSGITTDWKKYVFITYYYVRKSEQWEIQLNRDNKWKLFRELRLRKNE